MPRGLPLALLLLIAAGALLFRVTNLGNRPMHGDEAVHAIKFEELWKHGTYRYDPNEYHGPTLYYAALPSVILRGRHALSDTREADLRLPVAVVGAGMVLLLALLGDALGRRASLAAGALLALSPAFVFYSRYFIQETFLAFFTLALIACGWRWTRSRHPVWAALAGISAGLMIASKETAVLTFGALAVAVWAARFPPARGPQSPPDPETAAIERRALLRAGAIGLVALLVTASLFLSGFGSYPAGPLLYLKAFTPWVSRAQGPGMHRHPWYYYLQLLTWSHSRGGPVWSEGLIVLLAVVGLVLAFRRHAAAESAGSAPFLRFTGVYTLVLTLAYSVIPYKTPWCVLSFLLGMILLAGWAAATLAGEPKPVWGKLAVALGLAVAAAQLGGQAYRVSFVAYADPGNPYAYAQPVPDVEKLARRIDVLTAASPERDATVIKVFSIDNYYWPVPWYLRRFPNVGYWNEVPVGADADAPIILASPEFDDELTRRLPNHLMTGFFSLRRGVFLEVWVRMDLWQRYLEQKKRTAPPGGA